MCADSHHTIESIWTQRFVEKATYGCPVATPSCIAATTVGGCSGKLSVVELPLRSACGRLSAASARVDNAGFELVVCCSAAALCWHVCWVKWRARGHDAVGCDGGGAYPGPRANDVSPAWRKRDGKGPTKKRERRRARKWPCGARSCSSSTILGRRRRG